MSVNSFDIENDEELEAQNLQPTKKHDRKPKGDDPLSDWLLKIYYMLNQDSMKMVKIGMCAAPFIAIFLFSIFVSNTTSNMIAFSALVISVAFMAISIWILCEILDKDQGTRQMQDISDPIKEGSEGFFIT
jgi:hypothetical protein